MSVVCEVKVRVGECFLGEEKLRKLLKLLLLLLLLPTLPSPHISVAHEEGGKHWVSTASS